MRSFLLLSLCLCCPPLAAAAPADPSMAPGEPTALDPVGPEAEAVSLLKEGHYAAAAQSAEQAIRLDPKNTSVRYAQFLALMGQHKTLEAIEAANEALKSAPTDTRFWNARSHAHTALRQYEAGLSDAQTALSFAPKDAEAYVNAAWALDGLKRRDESLEYLKQAALLDQKYAEIYGRAQNLQGESPGPGGGASGWTSRLFGGWGLLAGALALAAGLLLSLVLLRPAWLRRLFPGLRAAGAGLEPSARSAVKGGADSEGSIAGGYQVVRQLGCGGMGVVYEAMDTALQRRVAVKKMREEIQTDPRERERFLKEARMVASLHHPNIVDIYAVVEDGVDAYLVFEYVDGKTIHELLKQRERLPLNEALGVLHGVAAALGYAHAQGMVHRDLKPANIMVNRQRQVKVMDFGVAALARDSMGRLAMTNTIVGTPAYMAPEQEQGVVCAVSDVYAMGICLYEMVSGELPFSGGAGGIILAKLHKTYVPASRRVQGLPPGFDSALDWALEPEPAQRCPSAAEFVAKIQSMLP